MGRLYDLMYMKRMEILTFLCVVWIGMSIMTRNPAEALILTILTAPITLGILILFILFTGV